MAIGLRTGIVTVTASAYVTELPGRMGGRAVEGTGLENRQARKGLAGSNPAPSASAISASILP